MGSTTLESPTSGITSCDEAVHSYPWTLQDILGGGPPPSNQPPDDNGDDGQGNGKGEYADLFEFVTSFHGIGLVLCREGRLSNSTVNIFADNSFEKFRDFLSTVLFNRDSNTYQGSLGWQADETENTANISIFLHYPTALSFIINNLFLVGQTQLESIEAIKNDVTDKMKGFMPEMASHSDLMISGYKPLPALINPLGQWMKTIFDDLIKPYLATLNPDDFLNNNGLNSQQQPQPPGQ